MTKHPDEHDDRAATGPQGFEPANAPPCLLLTGLVIARQLMGRMVTVALVHGLV